MKEAHHFSTEVSVSAELSEKGIKAYAKSRFLSAVDHLGGNVFEIVNSRLEQGNDRRRAVAEDEIKIIRAAADSIVDQMSGDPEFTRRAFENHFARVLKSQANKDAVLQETVEALQYHPPSDIEATSGPRQLDDQFMDRFEPYIATASTDQLRKRWAQVLASEIRNPGTFSSKTLRKIDEMDPSTAEFFALICKNRMGSTLPKCILPDLSVAELETLTRSGLIVEDSSAQIQHFFDFDIDTDSKLWLCPFENYAISVPAGTPFSAGVHDDKKALVAKDNRPGLSVYGLTETGRALASIFDYDAERTAQKLAARLSEDFTGAPTSLVKLGGASGYQVIARYGSNVSAPVMPSTHRSQSRVATG